MNRSKLIIFFIISIFVHIFIIYFINLPENDIAKKKEPIEVDIIKKKPFIKDLPSMVSKKQSKTLPDKVIPKVIPDKFVPKTDEILTKKDTEDKSLKEPNKRVEETKKEDIPKKEKEEKIEEIHRKEDIKDEESKKEKKQETTFEKEENKLSKEQISRLLKPKDVIEDIASGGERKEDEVNFNKFEVKYTSYFYKFRRQLYNVWRYPAESVISGEQGTVRIKFTILKDGTITNVNIVSSSGYSKLDKAAVDALRSMGKVPLPDSFGINVLNVDGFFIYQLGSIWIR
ncbi:MAG: energy transducer TonB [Deferribacterales bacterium]